MRAAVEIDRPAVAAFLEHAEAEVEGEVIHLLFSSQHSFFMKTVQTGPNLQALHNAAQQVYGRQMDIRLRLVERPAAEKPRPVESTRDRNERLWQQINKQPAVRAITDVFGARMVEIQPIEPEDQSTPAEADR